MKIKILMVATDMPVNGISTVIYNYCKNINKDKFNVTVIAGSEIDSIYRELFEDIDVKLIEFPSRRKKTGSFLLELNKFLQKNKFDIIHVHGNSATIAPELFLARRNKIKIRIAHSHNITCSHKILNNLLYPWFKRSYTNGLACSDLAGKWLFRSNKFDILANGFDTERYIFDLEMRNIIRKQMNLKGKYVIGHIGRFNNQKNHPFLLDVFSIIGEKFPNVYLLLVGTGPEYIKIKSLIDHHPFKDRIIIYGVSNQIEKLYNAMDLFVLPSKHEGLGIVMIEAQINGLPCIASQSVPKDTNISGDVLYLPIGNEEAKIKWGSTIERYVKKRAARNYVELKNKEFYQYDICNSVKFLEDYYLDCIRSNEK